MRQASEFQFDVTKTFPHLPSAPIVEAVIHLRARATKPWQPEQLKQELTEKLPGYAKCEPQRELHVHAGIDEEGSSTQLRRDSFLGFRLTSADGLHIAQFNRDGLVFSRLKPYDNWDNFADEGLRLWQIFRDLADPLEIQRIGVRFINQIPLRQISDLGKFLTHAPKCLHKLGLCLNGFFHQDTYDVPEHPYGINLVQTLQPPIPPDSDEFGFILDIDVFTKDAFECADEYLREHLPKMRLLKDEAFFSLLKPKAIESFRMEKK